MDRVGTRYLKHDSARHASWEAGRPLTSSTPRQSEGRPEPPPLLGPARLRTLLTSNCVSIRAASRLLSRIPPCSASAITRAESRPGPTRPLFLRPEVAPEVPGHPLDDIPQLELRSQSARMPLRPMDQTQHVPKKQPAPSRVS